MRDQTKRRYEGENFTTEKIVATVYLALFVLIIGMGVSTQLTRLPTEAKSPTPVEVSLR